MTYPQGNGPKRLVFSPVCCCCYPIPKRHERVSDARKGISAAALQGHTFRLSTLITSFWFSFSAFWAIFNLEPASCARLRIASKSITVAAYRMMPDLGFTQMQIGWLETAFLAGYTVMQFPGGILGQRLGARRMFTPELPNRPTFTGLEHTGFEAGQPGIAKAAALNQSVTV